MDSEVVEAMRRLEGTLRKAREPLRLCRACHYGHFNECEDERCQSMRLKDRHE